MSMIAAALKHMLAAGMDHDAIVAAVAEMEACAPRDVQADRRRAADRERKSRLRNSAESAERVSPKKETSPTPPKEKTTPSRSEPNGSSKSPRSVLETVLDAGRAGQVIDHRQRIRKPLTVRAAELLADQFAQCPDPNAAADAMVLNGWQGFRPEWLQRQQSRSPPRRPVERYDPFKALSQELTDEQDRSLRGDRCNRNDAQGIPILTIDYQQ